VDETGRTVDYGYDATYRLLNETITNDPQGTNGSIGYSYDATGNRLSRTSTVSGISNQSASYDANDRPTSDTYDDNGNLLTADGTSYRYDYANRLVSDGSITLTYDGDGTLVAQTVGGVTTTYLVDTQNPTGYAQIVEEQVNGQVQRTFSYGYDLISVNAVSGGSATPHFTGYDGLGTVRLLTDSAGTVTDQYEYEAFGGILHSSGSTANPYRFTGERYDADLDLYSLRARWYNQGTGRFLTMDTYPLNAHHPSEWNRYGYVANNPVNAVDPSGLSSINTYGLRLQTFAVPALASIPKVTTYFVAAVLITVVVVNTNVYFAKKGRPANQSGQIRAAIRQASQSLPQGCRIDPNDFGKWLEDYKRYIGLPRGDHLEFSDLVKAVIDYANEGGCK
jgi:RHS repeat-associated protein